MTEVIVCTIAGGSGAGKTTLARKLHDRLGDYSSQLAIDWYYRDLRHLTPADRAQVNYDHPDSLEVDLFCADLATLGRGESVTAPVYDFATHTRTSETLLIEPAPVIISEGIHLLALEGVRSLSQVRVFIDVSAELRLERRLRRDVDERGRDHDDVLRQWESTVAPMHDEFVQPSQAHATHVVAEDDDLDVVADQLIKELREDR